MQTALTHFSHPGFWVRAKAGEPVDFRRFLHGMRAVVDWPACEFLGQPVPTDEPFPHLNDRAFFRRVIVGLRVAAWRVPALVLAGGAAAAWWLFARVG
jgi:Sulfotransferase domain